MRWMYVIDAYIRDILNRILLHLFIMILKYSAWIDTYITPI